MIQSIIASITRFLYVRILRRIFFLFDPERVHDRVSAGGIMLGKSRITRALVKQCFSYAHPSLEQTVAGIRFINPVGLAAGFDKNAMLADILPSVGFGFMEVGSITGEACVGNAGPRLWRLKRSKSLCVYYGLKNDGAEIIAKRLKGRIFDAVLGVSIAKTNGPDTADDAAGIADYAKAYTAMRGIGDYVTINISCPNAYGGEPFTEANRFERLMIEIDKKRDSRPIFLKLSPDLTKSQLDGIIVVSRKHRVTGFICSNLTKRRDLSEIKDSVIPEKGGLSGKIVEKLADAMVRDLYAKTRGEFILIGCGGIFSAEDAYKKIRLGASLIQLITGMIYEGPQLIGEINRGLVGLLERDGFKNISEAVGVDVA